MSSSETKWSSNCRLLAQRYEATAKSAIELHYYLLEKKPELLGDLVKINENSVNFRLHREALQNFVLLNYMTDNLQGAGQKVFTQIAEEAKTEEEVVPMEIEAEVKKEEVKKVEAVVVVEEKVVKKVAKEVMEIEKVEEINKHNNSQKAPELSEEQKSEKKLRAKWYQDPSFAHFTIYFKNLRQDQVKVYFEREILTVDVHFDDGKIAREICPLSHPVLPEESRYTLNKYKISVALKKRVPADWDTYVTTEKKVDIHLNKRKKFEMLEKEVIEEKENDDVKDDPQAGIMGLMKKMYNDGTPEMKRMIGKTMYESQQKRNAGDFSDDKPSMGGMGGMSGGMGGMGDMMSGMGGMSGGMGDMSGGMGGMGDMMKGLMGDNLDFDSAI